MSRREIPRRRVLRDMGLLGSIGLAGCSGSSDEDESGDGDGTATPEPPHTPSRAIGNASVGSSSSLVNANGTHSMTVPAQNLDASTQLNSVSVDYEGEFDLSDIQSGDQVTVYVGEQLGTANTATVTNVSVGDSGTTLTVEFDGTLTVDPEQTIVVEYDGVRMPARPGQYAVTLAVNDEEVETGAVDVTGEVSSTENTFEETIEGWRVEGDAQGGSSFPFHEDSGGNPGGHLRVVDDVQGGIWYWVAPSTYHGDKSAFYGGTLAFDLKQSTRSSQFDSVDVAIEGREGALYYKREGTEGNPQTEWTHYETPLEESGNWRYDEGGSAPGVGAWGNAEEAGIEDIQTVLGNVQALHIRGEFVSGADTGYLDNVRLTLPDG